jgi:hypothetical protein
MLDYLGDEDLELIEAINSTLLEDVINAKALPLHFLKVPNSSEGKTKLDIKLIKRGYMSKVFITFQVKKDGFNDFKKGFEDVLTWQQAIQEIVKDVAKDLGVECEQVMIGWEIEKEPTSDKRVKGK